MIFSNESVLHIRWPKYWSFSFSFSNSPSWEYSGLISFRNDWFDFLTVQGTLKSLFQHHSSKASILWCSAFFMVQLSHPYVTTGKTIALTRRIFVGKVISLFLMCSLGLSFIQKTKIIASSPITSWEINGETMGTVTHFISGDSKITVDGDCSHEIKRCLLLERKAMANLNSVLKKQRHYFADKVPSSQSYGFCSSHVWM